MKRKYKCPIADRVSCVNCTEEVCLLLKKAEISDAHKRKSPRKKNTSQK